MNENLMFSLCSQYFQSHHTTD